MSDNWKSLKLGEVALLKRGYDLPASLRQKGEYQIISSAGVTDTHIDYKVKGPGVVTGRYGTIGKVFYTESDFWPLNTSLYVKDFNGNDPKFVYYLLHTINWQAYSTKSAVPGIDRNEVHQEIVCIPLLPEQQAISSILSAIDDKIELNLQMNNSLEEMAMALYKHRFVDFGPFQDGEFVDSELGMIPKGWEVKKLREYVIVINGYAFKGNDFIDSGVPVLKIKNVKSGRIILNNMAYVSKEVALKASKAKITFEDILITMTGNRLDGTPETWVGKVALFLRKGEYYLNQRVSKIKIKNCDLLSKFYLSRMLSTSDFQYYFISNSTSSGGQANISPDLIYNTSIVIPPRKELIYFDEFVSCLSGQVYSNELEIDYLVQLRDTLLPKLISGEVRVKEAAEILEEAI